MYLFRLFSRSLLATLLLLLCAFAYSKTSSISATDARGHTVRLDTPAKKIISLAPHLTELTFAVGAGAALVGVSQHCDYPPLAKSLPKVSDYQSVHYELITLAEPDIILAWGSGNKARSIARLQDLGHRVYVSDPKTIDDIVQDTLAIGQLTGNRANAVSQVAQFKQRIPPAVHTDKPLQVLYLLSISPAMTLSRSSWVSHIVQHCGGENVYRAATPAAPIINRESLLSLPIDLVVHSMDGTAARDFQALLGRSVPVLYVSADAIQRPSLRIADGIKRICLRLKGLSQKSKDMPALK